MPHALVNDDPLRKVAGDPLFVVKTSGGVLVRAVNKRSGFNMVLLRPLLAMYWALGPRITAIWFYDASRNAGERWIDLMHLDQDPKFLSLVDRNAHAATGVALFPHVGLQTGAITASWDTGDGLYIATDEPSGGVIIDNVTTNSNTAAMAGAYSAGKTFVAHTTFVDGSASGGVTLTTGAASATVSGEAITWTPQRAWTRSNLRDMVGLNQTDTPDVAGYWTRLTVDATLDSTVSITSIYAMAALTASATAPRGIMQAATEYSINLDDSVGGIEFISIAGSDTTVGMTWVDTRRTS